MSKHENCSWSNCEKKSLEQRNAGLEVRVNELSATVQLQRSAVESVLNRCDISNIPEKERKWLFSLTDPEPTQCLAEHDREVAAKAGKAGFAAGFDKCWYSVYGTNSPEFTVPALAEEYANKIKQGLINI